MLLSPIIFIGGKGGVGKSTLSSSLALHLSKNKKVLLISTDPAHNLNDIFGLSYCKHTNQIHPRLSLKQINPKEEVLLYTQQIAKKIKSLVGAHHYEMIDHYYKSAAENGITQESALFDCLIKLITTELHLWDHIIIDTAPTGHTLRFFTLAQTLKTWSKILLGHQQKNEKLYDILGSQAENPLAVRLKERYECYRHFQSLLTDWHTTSVMLVLNPDSLSISETKRAISQLKKDKIPIHTIIINKILPQSHDAFFQKHYEIQSHYLSQIKKQFRGLDQWYIPYSGEDILKEDQLLALISHLFDTE